MMTLEKLKKKQLDKSRLIGLDLGSKRIGVSICDENRSIATPLTTIHKTTLDNFITEIKKIISEYNIKFIY